MKFENNLDDNFKKLFNSLLAQNGIDLAAIAPNHYTQNTDNTIQAIVTKANKLASGNTQDSTQTNQTTGWQKFQKIRMVSILENLGKLENKEIQANKNPKYFLPILPLSLYTNETTGIANSKLFFPQEKDKFKETQIQDYTKLWEGFTKEVKQIAAFTDFKVFAETLLNLLHKYAITVPSSTDTSLQDISLYDHLKVATAISVCLYDYLEDKKRLTTPLEITNEEMPFILIGADISGIQSFLYDIISSKAAKNLKGRSFYLQLLTDSIVEKVISDLQLFSANVIYASGGNFFVLAPNTTDTKKELTKLEKIITDNLFKEHKTTLGFIMDFVEISKAEITGNSLGKTWDSLYGKLDVKKKQKNKLQMLNNYAAFFNPFEQGGITERDAITGEELDMKNAEVYDYEIDRNGNKTNLIYVSKVTNEQIKLGEDLKDFEYTTMSKQPISEDINSYQAIQLPNYFSYLSASELAKIQPNAKHISRCNNLDFLEKFVSANHSYGFSFYGGNKFPEIFATDKNKAKARYVDLPKTFSEMAGQKDDDRDYKDETIQKEFDDVKFKRLAILRMDVDNLGSLFKDGFVTDKNTKTSIATFSRLASLSRNLDYFFKGFLNVLWNSKADYRNYTQIIYSGGDDLFIVGRWNCIIDFAEDIQTHFAEWTCGNDKIGISGGITVVTPKFPISKAAELCEIDEKLAKYHKIEYTEDGKQKKGEKNAITLFGVPLNWHCEFPIVKELKNRLVDYVKIEDNKALLQKIQAFYQDIFIQRKERKEIKKLEKENSNSTQLAYLKQRQTETWRWRMAYDLARAEKRVKDKEGKITKLFNDLKKGIFTDSYECIEEENKKLKFATIKDKDDKDNNIRIFLDLLNLAARWAEFELRSEKQEE